MKRLSMKISLALVVLGLTASIAPAEQFGLFTYQVNPDDTVTITDYPKDAAGHVDIPAEIEGKPVTAVGEIAFAGCIGLTSIVIPEGVIQIGARAFYGCTRLVSVTVPSSTSAISEEAGTFVFMSCPSLTSIEVDGRNTHYSSVDGVLYNKSRTILIRYPQGISGDYIIPDSITTIALAAFADCTRLTSVVIPEGVTAIPNQCFADCTALSSVSIPEGVTEIAGGSGWGVYAGAFRGCSNLQHITLPSSLIAVNGGAFLNCSELTSITIPKAVERIGQWAFRGCISLTAIRVEDGSFSYASSDGVLLNAELTKLIFCPEGKRGSYTIPASVTTGAEWAFGRCKELTSFVVQEGNPNYASSDGVLLNAELTELLFCPEGKRGSYMIPSGVTAVSQYAFEACSKLLNIFISSSVGEIGQYSFRGCSSLTSIRVEEGNSDFASEEGVLLDAARTVLILYPEGKTGPYDVPEGITRIANDAFENCSALTAVKLPDGVSVIGGAAFGGCTALTSVTLPSSATILGSYAFQNCVSLTGISLPEGLTHIHNEVFAGCTELNNVEIPSSVATISGSAFRDCIGLTDISIAEGVTEIHGSAFARCVGLTSITFPKSVTTIVNGAFSSCNSLTTAIFLGNAPPDFGRSRVFGGTAPDFTIYYLSSNTGFTSPTWNGYPAVEIDVDESPAARWLLEHDLPHDTALHQDPNGDGVSLLMAYALDLDPRQNLCIRLPVPTIDGDSLNLSFPATRPELTYTVQTSTDLWTWTTEGVTTSHLDPDGRRTASVPRDTTQRFLRLVVE